ncbi:hypothetical protein G9A89_023678 [Geosiphon pyriformis]|nr:hypothetical protein G9A89_023678 [Geosiphon pyriformis]
MLGVLEYLAMNIEYTSGSFKDICHAFKEELGNIAEESNTLSAAKRKATKICDKLETTMERDIVIKRFLENQDLKLSQNRYRTKVELSVVNDKTTIVDMSSEQFAALVKGDRNLEDSDERGEHNGTENERGEKAMISRILKGEKARMNLWVSDVATKTNSGRWWEERKENQEKHIEDMPEGSTAEERRILVKNILEDSMAASPAEEASEFSLILDSVLQEELLREVFNHIDDYITSEIHEYLTAFFNEDHGFQGWSDAVDNIISTDCDSEFFKAFSLTAFNPLRDITTLEKVHLNQFIHPVIDSALWIFAKVNYIYGEIPLGLKT